MFEWKTEIENDIQISIASLVGERMFFDGDSTNGVTGDLDNATRLALVMESRWGMGETLASHQVLVAGSAGGAGRGGAGTPEDEAATKVSPVLGERVEQRLREIYDRTKTLLEANRYEILSLAHALEWHRTLNGADVEAVINRTRGPIIDGAVYGVESVRTTIEAYHAEAVHLHRTGQGQPRLPDVRAVIAATLTPTAG